MARSAPAAAAVADRDVAVDVGRGVAIVAIVLGHVLRGDAGAGLVGGSDPLFDELDTALYLWHLPVFAVLSGLFVGAGVERRGTAAYLRGRAVLFGWLYVLWTVVQGVVKLAVASDVNTPTSPSGILRSLVLPDSQLWWLPFLLLVSTAAAVSRPWRGGWRLAGSSALALAVGLAAWGHQGTVVFLQGLGLVGFFWAGAAGGRRAWSALASRALPAAAVGGGVAVAVAASGDPMTPTSWTGGPDVGALALGVLAAVAATAGVLGGSVLLARTRAGTGMALLGRRSLEIFLAHIVATAGTRVLLLRLGVTDLGPHLVLGTLAGVAVPLLLWWAGERVGAPWLFRAPRRLSPWRG